MTRITSTRYPGLLIADLGVRFVDKVLDTDDPDVVAACRAMAHLGVTVEELQPDGAGDTGQPDGAGDPQGGGQGNPGTGEATPPPGNGSRERWQAYAESRGLQVPDEATRDDIMALVAEAT